jgi:hypothetical protein
MSTGWVDTGFDAVMGARNLLTDTVKAVLLLDSYTFADAHDNLDDVSASAATNGTTAALTITSTNGVIDIADISVTPDTSQSVGSYYIYYDSGVASTSTLLFYMDSDKVSNLPLATDGSAVTLSFDAGASKFTAASPLAA